MYLYFRNQKGIPAICTFYLKELPIPYLHIRPVELSVSARSRSHQMSIDLDVSAGGHDAGEEEPESKLYHWYQLPIV